MARRFTAEQIRNQEFIATQSFIDGQSLSTIGRDLGISPQTVTRRILSGGFIDENTYRSIAAHNLLTANPNMSEERILETLQRGNIPLPNTSGIEGYLRARGFDITSMSESQQLNQFARDITSQNATTRRQSYRQMVGQSYAAPIIEDYLYRYGLTQDQVNYIVDRVLDRFFDRSITDGEGELSEDVIDYIEELVSEVLGEEIDREEYESYMEEMLAHIRR